MEKIRLYFERQGFEVCARLGERMGIPVYPIRLFFIYTSFLALGSPILLYMALVFLLRIKDYMSARKTSVFDL